MSLSKPGIIEQHRTFFLDSVCSIFTEKKVLATLQQLTFFFPIFFPFILPFCNIMPSIYLIRHVLWIMPCMLCILQSIKIMPETVVWYFIAVCSRKCIKMHEKSATDFLYPMLQWAEEREKCESASEVHCTKKASIHQVATMLATSKNVLFPGHNHRYWWPDTLIITRASASVGLSVPVVSRWLWPGSRTFVEVASMMVTWWIVFVFAQWWWLVKYHGSWWNMSRWWKIEICTDEWGAICMQQFSK